MFKPSILAVVLLSLSVLPAAAQEPVGPATPAIVTTGEAVIRRAPDQAFVTVAVESRAKAPRDAQKLNADAMTAVQQRLATLGLVRDAIRTTGYSIQQEFDFVNGRRVPREYLARNGVEVRVDAIDKIGEILDAVVAAGATNVAGVRFDLKDRAVVERDALKEAVADARARAEAMAAGAGRTLDRILRIDDTRQPRIVPMPSPAYRTMAAADAAAQTPIEAGLIEVRAQVTLTVAIK